MIHGIYELLRGQPDVNGMQDCAHHGHGKKAFKIPVAVPIQNSHGVAFLYPGFFQGTGQVMDPTIKGFIGMRNLIFINDFLLGRIGNRSV